MSKAEAELGKLRGSELDALQKAAASQGKADVLQKALQKAEERAANLEFQVLFLCISPFTPSLTPPFCIITLHTKIYCQSEEGSEALIDMLAGHMFGRHVQVNVKGKALPFSQTHSAPPLQP